MRTCLCSKVLQDHDLEEAVNIAGKIGYQGIELFGFERHLPSSIDLNRVRELRKLVDDLGMKVVVLATYVGGYSELTRRDRDKQIDEFKKYVAIAQELNCDMIRQQPGGPSPTEAKNEHWQRCAEGLQEVADWGAKNGIKIVLENHRGGLVETVDSSLKLLQMIARENVGISYDPGNVYHAGAEYRVEAIKKLGRAIFYVQIKDVDETADEKYPLLGEGKVDYDSVFQGLKEIGYPGYVAAECHKKPDEKMDSVGIARHEYAKIMEFLKKYGT